MEGYYERRNSARFIEAMLKLFEPVEEQYRQEKNLIQVFAKGNIDKNYGQRFIVLLNSNLSPKR